MLVKTYLFRFGQAFMFAASQSLCVASVMVDSTIAPGPEFWLIPRDELKRCSRATFCGCEKSMPYAYIWALSRASWLTCSARIMLIPNTVPPSRSGSQNQGGEQK